VKQKSFNLFRIKIHEKEFGRKKDMKSDRGRGLVGITKKPKVFF
jgi:hypothetical protein